MADAGAGSVRGRAQRPSPFELPVEVRAVAKTWGPGYLRFELDASTDFAADASFSVGVHHVLTGYDPALTPFRAHEFLVCQLSGHSYFHPV